jgi:hypothetical protein
VGAMTKHAHLSIEECAAKYRQLGNAVPVRFAQAIAALAWEPGASVALVARAHGVNANQVFKWRRAFERGEMSEPAAAAGEQSGARPLLAGNHGGSAGDHGSVALRCAPAIPPVPACIFDLLP